MKNSMKVLYVRWAGHSLGDGLESLDRGTNVWSPISQEDVRAFQENGGIVHTNPSFINNAS